MSVFEDHKCHAVDQCVRAAAIIQRCTLYTAGRRTEVERSPLLHARTAVSWQRTWPCLSSTTSCATTTRRVVERRAVGACMRYNLLYIVRQHRRSSGLFTTPAQQLA